MSSPTKTENEVISRQESQNDTTNNEMIEVNSTNVSPKPAPNASPTVYYNPSVSDDEGDIGELSRIKGDAIGDTLYSERFVLSTLLKLTKLESDSAVDEAFENDLCALWDMTIEEDVVKLLLEHNVLELFAQCIDATQDKRLTEILVGIVGNMCNVPLARKELCAHTEIIATLLQLISCSDALTLVQLMRLLSVVHLNNDYIAAEVWYKQIRLIPTFVEHFAFVLQNSVNDSLLTHALEALVAIIANFGTIEKEGDSSVKFADIFVCKSLVCGTLEAFQLLVPPSKKNQDSDSTGNTSEFVVPSQAIRKTTQVFLDIHVMLIMYNENSVEAYEPYLPQLIGIMAQVLEPLCFPDYLLPVSMNEHDIVDNVNEIFLALGDPYDDSCVSHMIIIWEFAHDWLEERQKRPPPANDFEADEDDAQAENEAASLADEMCKTILYFLTRMVRKAIDTQLDESLHKQSPHTIIKLIDALNANEEELIPIEDVKECCQKLNETFERLNKVANVENDSVPTK